MHYGAERIIDIQLDIFSGNGVTPWTSLMVINNETLLLVIVLLIS